MSGHHHERLVCSCGAVIMQCRCMDPKTDRVVQDGCEKCKADREALALGAPIAYAEKPGRDYRKERDAAYTERNRLGTAPAGSEHGCAKPFAFWSIKSDRQPSANGATTRPDK